MYIVYINRIQLYTVIVLFTTMVKGNKNLIINSIESRHNIIDRNFKLLGVYTLIFKKGWFVPELAQFSVKLWF